ncbi:hypothetical protein VOLCADRAFT_120286 [Volvox carteri f. nagariensis]|uniref:Pherophorin domain-containing protein n=1 Tax=Volvox carteri f. nagariensis TaxID=3068 RepID=D8TJ61_VOLCA|nr:uncharacterized protein VOLCADRAFT_120286 [Volvox carteri f. nagariensis]EFJ52320.1 hypothetical protein VOLCADRAFT_120286 [Volvox carteri f. nagariensis]|eukprot:XP_002946393.1 hypothetical protein VOLCADRAFT_120286 [Volvox carteri f. nagariensis]
MLPFRMIPGRSVVALAALLGLLAVHVNAGSLNCTAVMFLRSNYGGETFTISLAPQGQTGKTVIPDLAALPKPATYRSWDDSINSALLECVCTGSDCSIDYAQVTLRLFAEPYWRKNGGGDKIDVRCAGMPNMPSCAGLLPVMPKGWGSRTSAVALLYNLTSYVLPVKLPSSPPPATQPSPSPSPSSSPTPTPSPSPSSSPSPSQSPSPRSSPSPTPSPRSLKPPSPTKPATRSPPPRA